MANTKIVKAVTTVTVFSVFTRLLSFIFKIFLSRYVGAEVIGLYQISLSVFYLFASLSASGIPQVLSRKIAENEAVDGGKRTDRLVSSSLFLGIIISLSTVGVLLLIRDKLEVLFSDSRAVPLFIIMCPALISTTVYSIIRSWFWGKKEFTAYSITETIEEILRIVFTALLVSGIFAGVSDEKGIAIAFLVSDLAVVIVLFTLFFLKKGRLKGISSIKEILIPSIPLTAMRVLNGLAGTLLAIVLPLRLVASGMAATEATAAFGRITGMANPLLFAPNALISSVAIVLIPEIAASGVSGDCRSLNNHVQQGIKFSLLVSGIFVAVYVALGDRLTMLLYNDYESGAYLRFAAITMLPMAINQLLASSINSVGMEKQSFVSFALSSVVSGTLIIVLPPYLGIYSVVVATLSSLLVSIITNFIVLRKRTGLTADFVKTSVLVLLFIAPSAFFAYSLDGLLKEVIGIFSVVFSAAAGALFYILLLEVCGQVNLHGFAISAIRKKFGKKRLTRKQSKC